MFSKFTLGIIAIGAANASN